MFFKFFAAFLSCVLLLFCVSDVMAQDGRASIFESIPEFDVISDEEFETRSFLVEEEPMSDSSLDYKIRLPEGWRKAGREKGDIDEGTSSQSGAFTSTVLTTMDKYYGPASFFGSSRIEIKAAKMRHDVTAMNWFVSNLLSSGYSPQGVKEFSKTKIEALYVVIENGTTYIVRTLAQLNGTHMVTVSYYLPDMDWEAEKGIQQKTIRSFEFQNPRDPVSEIKQTYAFLDLVEFDYPVSWQLKAQPVYDTDGMDAKLINTQDGKVSNGEIDIHIISTELDTTLDEEVAYYKEDLEMRGLKVGELVENVEDDYVFQDHIYSSIVEVYETKSDDKDRQLLKYEFWMAILAEDRYYYIITMLSPSRNDDFSNWARNTEAFQTVLESMRP